MNPRTRGPAAAPLSDARGAAAPSVPVSEMVESIVGCKWSVRLLELISAERVRPSAMLRACPGLSAKVMNERLRKLTRFGIARRTVFGERPPVEVEYALTPFGRRFMGIIDEVRKLQDALDRGASGGARARHGRSRVSERPPSAAASNPPREKSRRRY